MGKIIAKGNLNIANLMQTFKKIFSKTTQKNSEILYPNSAWVYVIHVCSNGAATDIIGEIIAKDNLT